MTADMKTEMILTQLPLFYTNLVIEKSNLLLRANMLEAQSLFDQAAELFAKSANIEAQLTAAAQQDGRLDAALIHLVSEMSCWAAAGDTYHALSRGQQMLALPTLTAAQRTHIREFVDQVNQRRHAWMSSWRSPVPAIA